MNKILIIELLLFVLCTIEAYHDYHLIKTNDNLVLDNFNKRENFNYHNKAWHDFDGLYMILLSVGFSYALDCYWIILIFFAMRIFVFAPILNMLRGKDFFYLSNSGVDKFWQTIFGKYAGQVVIIGSFVLTIILNFFLL